MPKSINEYFQPSSTNVHNNIDDLILQAELDKLAQTGSMRADTRPQYIGGVHPFVENIALSPLLQLKSLGSVGKKILEKTGLRNPISHYTRAPALGGIMKSGSIRGREAFPGKPFKRDTPPAVSKLIKELEEKTLSSADELQFYKDELIPGSPSVSVTRDPMFLSRPHKSIGTDIKLVMDRDELIKKGLKIQPFVHSGFEKVSDLSKAGLGKAMNRIFEFEERVRGNIPVENIKLIDILKFPKWKMEEDIPNVLRRKSNILSKVISSGIPMVMSDKAKSQIFNMLKNKELLTSREIRKITNTPTYKFDPFKR
tara:strand:- start:1771 stop:2706 length:936 start_codon:yes stop_codon:yes gene_type:complete